MAKRDWRVLYGSYSGENHTRSKPFDTEDQALAWAITWVKGQGPDIQPMAHVYHREVLEAQDLDEGPDPVPRSHRITWAPVGDELRLLKRTWPSKSRADHDAEVRRVMREAGKPDGPKIYTEDELVDQMPLRVV